MSYANDFVDPDFIVKGNFGNNTLAAQNTIIEWAKETAAGGPWAVTDKAVAAPTGNKHDYLSWAPYWWPDCSGVGNKTELTPEQIWTTCPYKSRDGQFNPDVRAVVNDIGRFENLSDAVFYNTLAWSLTKEPSFAESAVNFIRTWFIDDATRMTPNLNYAQVERGPDNQNGTHTGVLDLKCMTKVVNGILILRKSNSSAWTTDLDNSMNAWVKEYTGWLETAPIAIEEEMSANNHGSFYYNQLASLKILVGDFSGAKSVTDRYFNTLYMAQIVKGGDQPFETARTRPYHYRAYNLAAMITSARLSQYADPSDQVWHKPTKGGATIKDAADFAMGFHASDSHEGGAGELYPNVAAVASVYGDPDGKYLAYLKQVSSDFPEDASYLWDQPFAVEEGLAASPSSSVSSPPSPSGNNNQKASSSPGAPLDSSRTSSAVSKRMTDFYGLFSFSLSVIVYLLI